MEEKWAYFNVPHQQFIYKTDLNRFRIEIFKWQIDLRLVSSKQPKREIRIEIVEEY